MSDGDNRLTTNITIPGRDAPMNETPLAIAHAMGRTLGSNGTALATLFGTWLREGRPEGRYLVPPRSLDAVAALSRNRVICNSDFSDWIDASLTREIARQRRWRHVFVATSIVFLALAGSIAFVFWDELADANGRVESLRIDATTQDERIRDLAAKLVLAEHTETAARSDASKLRGDLDEMTRQQSIRATELDECRSSSEAVKASFAAQLASLAESGHEARAAALLQCPLPSTSLNAQPTTIGSESNQREVVARETPLADASAAWQPASGSDKLMPELEALVEIESLPTDRRTKFIAALLESFPFRVDPIEPRPGFKLIEAESCVGDLLMVHDSTPSLRFWEHGARSRAERKSWRLGGEEIGLRQSGLDGSRRWLATAEVPKGGQPRIRVRDLAAESESPDDILAELDTTAAPFRGLDPDRIRDVLIAADRLVLTTDDGNALAFDLRLSSEDPSREITFLPTPARQIGSLQSEHAAIAPDGSCVVLAGTDATVAIPLRLDSSSSVAQILGGTYATPTFAPDSSWVALAPRLGAFPGFVRILSRARGSERTQSSCFVDSNTDGAARPVDLPIAGRIKSLAPLTADRLIVETDTMLCAFRRSGVHWEKSWQQGVEVLAQLGSQEPLEFRGFTASPGTLEFFVHRSDGSEVVCSAADGGLRRRLRRAQGSAPDFASVAADGHELVTVDWHRCIVRTWALRIDDESVSRFSANPELLRGR